MKDILRKLAPQFFVDVYHLLWSFLGALIYRFPAYSAGRPSKKIKVIGITGTNGKTTVTHLTTEILEAAGYKVASISSLRFKLGERSWKNTLKITMPGRMKIQQFLRQAVDAGCHYMILEVTSEGIKQHRHKFIEFDTAVFTNLTPEHIERHGGFENYKKAKGELFRVAKNAVINLDDENADYFSNLCKGKKYGYSINSSPIDFHLALPGEFNLSNALAATYVGLSQGIDAQVIRQVLENFKGVPGRMEVVAKEPFTVIVDYAHTPDALQKVYETLSGENPKPKTPARSAFAQRMAGRQNSKMICILGAAGGGRDKWKRPEMGKIAAQYCDQIILTDEDSYNEPPIQIIQDIKRGIPNTKYQILNTTLDRREAIKKALQIARPGDTVIITGKGAEPLMMTKEGAIPWDDREIVRELISQAP